MPPPEGADGAIAMDVCDDAEGGSSVVNAASRRTCTRTSLDPANQQEVPVLGKDRVQAIRPTIAATYLIAFKEPPEAD